jgi:CrcB protein
MGFLSQDRRLFRQEWGHAAPTPPRPPLSDHAKAREQANSAASHAKVKKTIPLYIGLATGFCGSLTSFSSFLRDVFLAFLNDLRSPNADVTARRNDGYSVMAGLAVIVITIALCYSALKAGAHAALLLDRFTPTLPFRRTRAIVDPLVAFIAWGAWLGAVFMAIWPPDRHASNETWRGQAVFACVFGPLGCLLRFYASLTLNPISPSFPLGTFAVNIVGTAVLGMAWDLQHIHLRGSGVGGGRVACQVLQGIMDGFDGCLTTVSTWILEIDTLKTNHAWKYAFASVAAGVCVLVVVMGSVRWSVGWTETACVTTRSW